MGAREVIRHLAAAAAAAGAGAPSLSSSSSHTTDASQTMVDALFSRHLEGLLTMIFVPDSVATVEGSEAAHRESMRRAATANDPEKGDDATTPSIVSWRANSNPARRAFDAALRESARVCGPSLVRVVPVI